MGVYLPNMEMPKSCYYCPMTNDGFYLCKATSPFKELENDCEECKPQWCPLIPVPPHGRLIDADALDKTLEFIGEAEEQIYGNQNWKFAMKCRQALENAPTVIEAEEGET